MAFATSVAQEFQTYYDEETGGYFVKGERASSNEYYVALSLEKHKVNYRFQVPIYGGRQIRGGIIVDFTIVGTAHTPMITPVEVFGEHWHTGTLAGEDSFKLAVEQQYFKVPPIILWGNETSDEEIAERTVVRKVL